MKQVPIEVRLEAVRELAGKMAGKIEQSLPRHLTAGGTASAAAARLYQVFVQEITRSPAVLEDCTPRSIVGAFAQAAGLGLELGPTLGQAYLVPRKDDATLIVGYRGFIALAERSGRISTIEASIVRKGDVFKYARGTRPFVSHEPKLLEAEPASREKHEKNIVAAYTVVVRREGVKTFDVMSAHELWAVRARARRRVGPWWGTWQDLEEMCRKTPTRRVLKYAPMSAEVQHAVGLDEQADADLPQHNEDLVPDDFLAGPGDQRVRGRADEIAEELAQRGKDKEKVKDKKRAAKAPSATGGEAGDSL